MFEDEKTKEWLRRYVKMFPKGNVLSISVINRPNKRQSRAAEFIADELGANLHSVQGSRDICKEELIGTWELDEEDKKVTWDKGTILKALEDANYRGESVLEIRDMHKIRPECQLHLNSILTDPYCITIPERANERICLNENSKLILVAENTVELDRVIRMQEAVEDKMQIRLDNF